MIPVPIPPSQFHYTGKVTAVHDGDTFTPELMTGLKVRRRNTEDSVGLHLYVRTDGVLVWRWPLRLWGSNAPELTTPDGIAAANALKALLPIGSLVFVRTYLVAGGTDKYGRILGDVTTSSGLNVSQYMIDNGFAVPYFGGPR